MKSTRKLAGRSLSPALPDEHWLEAGREDARGASEVLSTQESTPGPRWPAGAIPELLPHAPDQEWLHSGIEPPQRHYPVVAILGCVPAELNVCLQHPGGSFSGAQTQLASAQKPLNFHLGPRSSSLHFSPHLSWLYSTSV